MRVFLDTNVLVSALATRGFCAEILDEVIAGHEMLISPELLRELERVLSRKFSVTPLKVAEVSQMLRSDCRMVHPAQLPAVQLEDTDDLPILAAALTGKAQILVTGGRELLALRRVESLEILSPRQFWERLREAARTAEGESTG